MEQNTKGSTNNKDIQLDDILERINGIFGQYNSKRVTHKECLTHENFKDFKSTGYFITKYFIDNQLDTTDIRRTLRAKHIDYTNDILLKIDNQRDDDSDSLIKQIAVHDKELPLEFTLNNDLSESEEKAAINNLFGDCITGLSHDINSISFNFEENKIKNTCCQHFNNNSNELIFYETSETLTSIISKRLLEVKNIYKVYCYCYTCRKIFCIYREEQPSEIENIIEHIPIGRRIIEHVEKEVDSLLDIPKELGYCHAFWDLKEKILLGTIKYFV